MIFLNTSQRPILANDAPFRFKEICIDFFFVWGGGGGGINKNSQLYMYYCARYIREMIVPRMKLPGEFQLHIFMVSKTWTVGCLTPLIKSEDPNFAKLHKSFKRVEKKSIQLYNR